MPNTTQKLLRPQTHGSSLQADISNTRPKKKPLSISLARPAQPGLIVMSMPIPNRHGARESVLQASAPAGNDMDTWAHSPPCKREPPSVLHKPSGRSSNICQAER
eukprot:1062761-Amphidinium_carterae.1